MNIKRTASRRVTLALGVALVSAAAIAPSAFADSKKQPRPAPVAVESDTEDEPSEKPIPVDVGGGIGDTLETLIDPARLDCMLPPDEVTIMPIDEPVIDEPVVGEPGEVTIMPIDETVTIDPIEEPVFDIMPVDEEVLNEQQRDLAEYLDGLGIAYTMHDEDGWLWVEVDYNDVEAANAVEDFYWNLSPMDQATIDQINAEADAIAAFLQARGIDATVTTDRHGLKSTTWNYDDPAAQLAVEDFYWEQSPMDQATIDQINADAEALVAFLQSKGIDASVETDRHGLKSAAYEWSEAVDAALIEYWGPMTCGGPIEPMPVDDFAALAR